jgi:PPOX class probable F420-dependent enzyme
MTDSIPSNFSDLFEKKAFAHFGTIMSDGTPQISPVWFDRDGDVIRVNSAKGRLKDRNVERDPRVTLSIQDPEDPYRYLMVKGKVEEITETGADDHIDSLAKKYLGLDQYPYRSDTEVRVIYKISAEKVYSFPPSQN